MSIAETSDESQSPPLQYVGFWLRLLASLIDTIPIAIILYLILPIFLGPSGQIDLSKLGEVLSRLSIETLTTAILVVLCWMYFATTPGKVLLGAYIADARTGKRASTGQLVIRYLGYYPSMLALMLGFIWIGFDSRKQGWHDKIAGTVVIKGKPAED